MTKVRKNIKVINLKVVTEKGRNQKIKIKNQDMTFVQ